MSHFGNNKHHTLFIISSGIWQDTILNGIGFYYYNYHVILNRGSLEQCRPTTASNYCSEVWDLCILENTLYDLKGPLQLPLHFQA